MPRQELDKLFDRVWDSYEDVVNIAGRLSNKQLDARIPWYGSREAPIRAILYQMVGHAREHGVHLTKFLQATGAPGGQPTEGQLILGEIAEGLGALYAVLARMSDADLNREFEGETVHKVLEHVASTQEGYLQRIRTYLESAPATSVS